MPRHTGRRRRVHAVAVAALLALVVSACGLLPRPLPGGPGHGGRPVRPLSHHGRWFTDSTGRVVTLHGLNDVAKSPPFYPAAFGFGDDDAAFLEEHGFNVFRLGVEFQGLMPEPGRIDTSYIEHLAKSVEDLAHHHIFVVLDFHQDGFGPMFRGNGFPAWMSITDGLPNPPDATFPLYYVTNPALQRAFEHFWANSPGPDGIGLQDSFMKGLRGVAQRFAGNPWVLGYEAMNEPWPGSDWVACSTAAGCPDLEARRLRPFYEKAAATLRGVDREQFLFMEPFVLFNFGQGPTTVPGFADPQNALSFHSYALDPTGEEGVVRFAVEDAQRQGVPLVATEFGATIDPRTLDRITGELDGRVVSWLDWAYNESIVARPMQPAGLDNVRSRDAFASLVRPFPVAVAGTPTRLVFDPATIVFDLGYDTARPGGGRYPFGLLTTVSVPALRYPQGYTVAVQGARVVSQPCAARLLLRNEPHASSVSLRVTPGGRCR